MYPKNVGKLVNDFTKRTEITSQSEGPRPGSWNRRERQVRGGMRGHHGKKKY